MQIRKATQMIWSGAQELEDKAKSAGKEIKKDEKA
jgi:hypothetical protein